MANRRHMRSAILCLMAALIVLPPLTSAVADGLGIDMTHHHCDFDVFEAALDDHAADLGAGQTDRELERHGSAESDPFQCDQCHIVLAAMSPEMMFLARSVAPLPDPEALPVLASVPPSQAFKPPIV